MAKQDRGTLHVIAAAYDELYAAVDDYETIKDLYRDVRTEHGFDASVIAKDEDGEVRIVRRHEQQARHGAAVGLGWGLAVGVAAMLFPPAGIGVAAAGGAGAAVGGVAGHLRGALSRSDLEDLGATLDAGQAGLIVVYEATLAEHIASITTAAVRVLSKPTGVVAGQPEPVRAPETVVRMTAT